jgi:hypothetical protein
VISACIAPFLLLRTPRSVDWALKRANVPTTFLNYFDFVERIKKQPTTLRGMLRVTAIFLIFLASIPFIGLILLGIRFLATAITVTKAPIVSVLAIPTNWWRIVGCVDSFHPPEPLPGYLAQREQYERIDETFVNPWQGLKNTMTENNNYIDIITNILISPIFVIFIIIPTLVYRWSLKGSSVIYLPLLWVVHTVAGGSLRQRFIDICSLSFYRFRRWFGGFIIFFVMSKLLAATFWKKIYETSLNHDPYGFLTLFVAPLEVPRWQLASATNGLLAWLVFFVAEVALSRDDESNIIDIGNGYVIAIRSLWLISSILTLYILMIIFYNVATLQWNLLSIGEHWFPWQA